MRNRPHYPGEGTLPGTKTPIAGRPFLLIGAGAVAAVLALIVVAAVAWRTVGTTTVAATTSPGPDTEVAAPDLTPDITPDLVPETTPSPSPPARTKTAVAKPRPTRGSVSMTPTPRRTTSKPTPSKTPAKRTRTPRPTPTRTTAAPPSEDPAPQWRCRDWFTVTRGVEMSPCIAQADGAFQVMGRIRGSASIRSDIRVQLYDTDADTGLGQPFVCAGVAPAADGAVVTCGPRTATALRTGAKLDVRQSWRKAGAPSFSGGVESPWVLW